MKKKIRCYSRANLKTCKDGLLAGTPTGGVILYEVSPGDLMVLAKSLHLRQMDELMRQVCNLECAMLDMTMIDKKDLNDIRLGRKA
jgi:hypothetical protein